MSLLATWDWRPWTLAVLLLALMAMAIYRRLAALAFQFLLSDSLARRYGWQADRPGDDGARRAFDESERQRRRAAWTLLRNGRAGIREGYRTGVFGKVHQGAWHTEIMLRGMWRGRRFIASQIRRHELVSGPNGTGAKRRVRRRAAVTLIGSFPACLAHVTLLGRVEGQAPPALSALLRSHPWRFRNLRADGGGISVELGSRLRRGQLLAALDYLNEAADRVTRS